MAATPMAAPDRTGIAPSAGHTVSPVRVPMKPPCARAPTSQRHAEAVKQRQLAHQLHIALMGLAEADARVGNEPVPSYAMSLAGAEPASR